MAGSTSGDGVHSVTISAGRLSLRRGLLRCVQARAPARGGKIMILPSTVADSSRPRSVPTSTLVHGVPRVCVRRPALVCTRTDRSGKIAQSATACTRSLGADVLRPVPARRWDRHALQAGVAGSNPAAPTTDLHEVRRINVVGRERVELILPPC